jgi:hypothetical protein
MFSCLLGVETRKFLKHPASWLGLGILTLMLAVFFIVRYAGIADAAQNGLINPNGLELDLQAGLSFLMVVGVMFYAANAAIISVYDFPDRSIQLWLARGVPRPLLLAARLVVILVVGFCFIVFTVMAILGLAALSSMIFLGGVNAKNLEWMRILPVTLRMFAASIPYLMLAVGLGVISRSPLFATAGTLIFATVIEKLLDGLSDKYPALIQFIPARLADALQFYNYTLDRSASPMALGSATLTESQAVLTIGVIMIVFSTLIIVIFSHQDFGG